MKATASCSCICSCFATGRLLEITTQFLFFAVIVNPIPAEVLENQDMLGGSIWPPPSKSHVWCLNMTNDTSLERSCALLLESAKKFANLQKLNFLSQNPVI